MGETALGGSSPMPALDVIGLSKTFPGTIALDDVALTVMPGEVHALVGQNGSGKSTLIKVLAGYHNPDEDATISVYGERVGSSNLRGGEERLRFVHQDLGLFGEMNVVDNIALRGKFIRNRVGTVAWSEQAASVIEIIREFDPRIRVDQNVDQLTPVQRTIVAIAAALASRTNEPMVLVLDEPTAVLPREEVRELLQIVQQLKGRGDSILYVSHRLDEVIEVADSVTVLRGGRVVASRAVTGLDTQSLAELMVGAEVDAHFRAEIRSPQSADSVLEISGLQGDYLQDFTLTINAGEIIGVAGLPGSGREELPYLIAGYARRRGGTVLSSDGRAVESSAVPIVPASRLDEGIISGFTVKENVTLSFISHLAKPLVLSGRRERGAVDEWVDALSIKAGSIEADIASLSGGNQQKTVIARGLMLNPSVLVLSEPTAGVDVGARQAIYELLARRARQGLAILVSSTDIGDLLAICTKVLVLSNGEVTAVFDETTLNEKSILAAMERS